MSKLKEIERVEISDTVSISYLENEDGKKYIDLRKYYYDTFSNSKKPTQKGICFTAEEAYDVFSSVIDIIDKNLWTEE